MKTPPKVYPKEMPLLRDVLENKFLKYTFIDAKNPTLAQVTMP